MIKFEGKKRMVAETTVDQGGVVGESEVGQWLTKDGWLVARRCYRI